MGIPAPRSIFAPRESSVVVVVFSFVSGIDDNDEEVGRLSIEVPSDVDIVVDNVVEAEDRDDVDNTDDVEDVRDIEDDDELFADDMLK